MLFLLHLNVIDHAFSILGTALALILATAIYLGRWKSSPAKKDTPPSKNPD